MRFKRPRFTGKVNGYDVYNSREDTEGELGIVTFPYDVTLPSSVKTLESRRISHDGKKEAIRNLQTLNVYDLLIQNIGATQH